MLASDFRTKPLHVKWVAAVAGGASGGHLLQLLQPMNDPKKTSKPKRRRKVTAVAAAAVDADAAETFFRLDIFTIRCLFGSSIVWGAKWATGVPGDTSGGHLVQLL